MTSCVSSSKTCLSSVDFFDFLDYLSNEFVPSGLTNAEVCRLSL
jgi:hypothetical protein